VTLLRGHCTAGRLTLDEFSGRVGAALAARIPGEAEATLADLPSSTFWECLGAYRDELEDPGSPVASSKRVGLPAKRRVSWLASIRWRLSILTIARRGSVRGRSGLTLTSEVLMVSPSSMA
jgi:hypothetical protein